MPVNNGKFDYPETGWSTARMKRKGDKQTYQPSFEEEFAATAPKPGRMTREQWEYSADAPDLGKSASGKAEPVLTDRK
jgi:hypothetical protein